LAVDDQQLTIKIKVKLKLKSINKKKKVYLHCPMGTYLAAIHQLIIIVEWW